jgi:hypothetical protein
MSRALRHWGAGVFAVGLLFATPAPAAVTIGSTFAANEPCSAVPTTAFTAAQTTAPAGVPYEAPSSGVITSWSHHSVTPTFGAGNLKFKVVRPMGSGFFSVVGESAAISPVPGLNTSPVRIPVEAGDIIGLTVFGPTNCYVGQTGPGVHATATDAPPGPTAFAAINDVLLDVSATLEPDGDGDGFGDESQDGCLNDATDHGDCTPPETTVTAAPKSKTKSKRARVAFVSSEGNSSFRCSLDGGAFDPCSSPQRLKVPRGKHAFVVVAKDGAANVDETPAVVKWTVKKKKRKRR